MFCGEGGGRDGWVWSARTGVGVGIDGGIEGEVNAGVGFVDGGACVFEPFVVAAFVFAVVFDAAVGVVVLLLVCVVDVKKTMACHACTQKLLFLRLLY